MQNKKQEFADEFLIETSWEVCNKVGGIYTVLSSKAAELRNIFDDRLVFIGPDIHTDDQPAPDFKEYKTLLKGAASKMRLPYGISIRVGRWAIPGKPLTILVNYAGLQPQMNDIFGQMWNDYGVDSLHAYGDYTPSCTFAVAAAIVIEHLVKYLKLDASKLLTHWDEWTVGMGLLYTKKHLPAAATIFTTHATSIGRSICSNGKPLYEYFHNYNGDQMASELNMESKHSLEKTAAREADCFTTVSDVTAAECTQLLGVTPAVITPNGFNHEFVPTGSRYKEERESARRRLLDTASMLNERQLPTDTMIVATSGRNEYRNKGIDLYIDAMRRVGTDKEIKRPVLALILVPAWTAAPNTEGRQVPYATHRLYNESEDAIWNRLAAVQPEVKDSMVTFMYVPCYLDGKDGVINISYYQLMPGIDATLFPSYYEPWGYTPLESVAFGIPTVTTDKSGFGQWVKDTFPHSMEKCGVAVVERNDMDYATAAGSIAHIVEEVANYSRSQLERTWKGARDTAAHASWSLFIKNYEKAYETAIRIASKRMKHTQRKI